MSTEMNDTTLAPFDPSDSNALGAAIGGAGVDLAVSILRALLASGEYPTAVYLMRHWGDRFDDDTDYLKVRRAILGKTGELSEVLLLTHRLIAKNESTVVASAGLEGRLKELLGVRPRILGPLDPIEPASHNRVMHLAKESRPYLSNGFTSRSHNNFLAEKSAGLDPVVVTEPGFPRNGQSSPMQSSRTVDGIKHIHLDLGPVDLTGMPADRYLQLFADMAYASMKEIRPAVIHASSGRRGFETVLVALALKAKTGIPVVYEVRSFFETNWTSEIQYEASGEIYERRLARELDCMQSVDLVLTIGESMREELISRGIAPNKIGLIPNGVDCDRFQPRRKDQELAKSLGVGSAPTFGYVSNMDHHRESQETLIRATAHLAARGRPDHCVLVGDGPRRHNLEHLAEDLGVQERVHFTGRVDHSSIHRYYSLIDTFVVPRIAERAATYVTPLKPFEAMAMGLPLVVSSLPGLVEIADPPHRGWAFPPGDAGALSRVLEQIADNPQDREKRASAGLSWVRQERQWNHNGPRYVEYFDALTGRDSEPTRGEK
ncbi:glycosyltransferase family 4 protein [Kocuria sp. ICS0012]|uniref:glycosyltransferase family 4 protein n=1 Tax=Kocuria sp. ICS0012 TaxID=1834155 RepID=UPI0009EE5208|nr:glycosyltransferase family 4 protein [Kocuria sp. ICS0012]